MDRFLIDTDIIIDFFKQKHGLDKKLKSVGLTNCYISEISLAELLYGAFKSSDIPKQIGNVDKVRRNFHVVPITNSIERYGSERLRLEKLGQRIPDFDLLIAVTAVENNLILVTGNEKHHKRVSGIQIENWRKKKDNKFA